MKSTIATKATTTAIVTQTLLLAIIITSSNAYANDEVIMMMHCHDYTNFTDSLGRNKCELQGVCEQEQISATDMAKVAWYVCFFVLPT